MVMQPFKFEYLDTLRKLVPLMDTVAKNTTVNIIWIIQGMN